MVGGLLGELSPGERKLRGKSFYLDNLRKRSAALLVEAVAFLGGKVESFLHKDVSFVVTGSQQGPQEQKDTAAKGESGAVPHPTKPRENCLTADTQRQATPRPVCFGSRGKALLEKAIRNNERWQGSSALDNARSWGVKILLVDDVLLYLQRLTRESSSAKPKKKEQRNFPKPAARVVKAVCLKSPYLKVEDLSRKFRPLHMQSMTVPTLCYSGRFSPFEPPPPPPLDKPTGQEECKAREVAKAASVFQDGPSAPLDFNPLPWRALKKDRGYCESCLEPFSNQEEHLQSEKHRCFVLDSSNYSLLDRLVRDMQPGFNVGDSQNLEAAHSSTRPSPATGAPSPAELAIVSDGEAEHAIQALLNQGSSSSAHFPSLSTRPPSPCRSTPPPSPSDTTRPASLIVNEPFPPNPAPPSPGAPRPGSPPGAQGPPPGAQGPSPCTETLSQSSDPYSLPPVLSPQVYGNLEPHSPYSEPPVLRPEIPVTHPASRWYPVEYDAEAPCLGVKTVELASQLVTESNWKELLVHRFPELINPDGTSECTELPPLGSHSPLRMSTTAVNPKKRCQTDIPKHEPNKRRRTSRSSHHTVSQPANEFKAQAFLSFDAPQILLCTSTDCTPAVERVDTCRSPRRDSGPGGTVIQRPNVQGLQMSCGLSLETHDAGNKTRAMFLVPDMKFVKHSISNILGFGSTPRAAKASGPVSPGAPSPCTPPKFSGSGPRCAQVGQHSHPSSSHPLSSVCIEPALVPDVAALSSSSSDSDWDCELLSQLGPARATPPALPSSRGRCELDQELLQRPCTWTHNTSYESRLHSVLQPSTPAASMFGDEMEATAFSRTVVQIVQVQH